MSTLGCPTCDRWWGSATWKLWRCAKLSTRWWHNWFYTQHYHHDFSRWGHQSQQADRTDCAATQNSVWANRTYRSTIGIVGYNWQLSFGGIKHVWSKWHLGTGKTRESMLADWWFGYGKSQRILNALSCLIVFYLQMLFIPSILLHIGWGIPNSYLIRHIMDRNIIRHRLGVDYDNAYPNLKLMRPFQILIMTLHFLLCMH